MLFKLPLPRLLVSINLSKIHHLSSQRTHYPSTKGGRGKSRQKYIDSAVFKFFPFTFLSKLSRFDKRSLDCESASLNSFIRSNFTWNRRLRSRHPFLIIFYFSTFSSPLSLSLSFSLSTNDLKELSGTLCSSCLIFSLLCTLYQLERCWNVIRKRLFFFRFLSLTLRNPESKEFDFLIFK